MSMTNINLSAGSNILCNLSHLGLIEISGADAVTFLQGQVTNDVNLLDGTNAHYSAYCNPKGRMLALFLVFAHYDHLHLQLNSELLVPIMKRLKMYVMRSKVEIKDVSESIIKFGLNGPQAASMLEGVFSSIPTEKYALVSLENGAILKLPSYNDDARFEIFTDSTNAPIIWDALKNNGEVVEKPHWDWLEIQAGIPDVEFKTQEQFVPQMLNLDIVGAINFKKGCYTGQEIVARTHYLGTVKRRTYLAEIAADSQSDIVPQAGDKVLDSSHNEVGQIVRIAPSLANGFDALIEMRIEAQLAGRVYWNNVPISTKNLPYLLET